MQALNDAKRELRYLLVYLHGEDHQDTDEFCRYNKYFYSYIICVSVLRICCVPFVRLYCGFGLDFRICFLTMYT